MPLQERSARLRHLAAARLLGSVALLLLGQLAVEMPEGYFGSAGEVTVFGALCVVGAAIFAGLLVWGRLGSPAWRDRLAAGLYSVHLGLFIPALAGDPVVAGAIVLWHLVLVFQQLLGEPPDAGAGSPKPADERNRALADWLAESGPAVRHLLALTLAVTVAVVGFRLAEGLFAQAVCLVLNLAAGVAALPFAWRLWRSGHRTVWLLLLPLVFAPWGLARPAVFLSLLALTQAVLLLVLAAQGPLFAELFDYFFERPALLTLFAFGALVGLGTLLLSFPAASATNRAIPALDALFTSTSATCVTGLIVLDTPVDFSLFGQCVILALIQVGGLGIMVLSTFATLLLGGRLGLRGGQALAQMMELRGSRDAYRLTIFIVLSTLAIEAVGALLLAVCYLRHGLGWPEAAWRGVFHAISAFCNAGFALQSDSLSMFRSDPLAQGTVMMLIVLGGIGFLVMTAFWHRLRRRPIGGLALQARLVGWTTVGLLAAGMVLFALTEWNASLGGLPTGEKLLNGLFQSVTSRTAGFNTVDLARLAPATVMVLIVLMFVGASPGGTGGGIKTTTAVVLLSAVRAIAGGRAEVVLFKRRVPQVVVYRSLAIAFISLGVGLLGLFLLLLSQDQPPHVLAFEVFSALGTVGLSLGATPLLDPVGKLVIIAVMFVGRVGPLTVALLFGHRRQGRIVHPESQLMVG